MVAARRQLRIGTVPHWEYSLERHFTCLISMSIKAVFNSVTISNLVGREPPSEYRRGRRTSARMFLATYRPEGDRGLRGFA